MDLLNLGCGERFHPAWTNLDFSPSVASVIKHDLTQGIPFPAESFDAVYHSHLLEHFSPSAGEELMAECYRVLRPAGIIRVVVPDLEGIVREYLRQLKAALRNEPMARENYEWIMLELYDQVVRTVSGGDIARYLSRPDLQNRKFLLRRIGKPEAELYWEHLAGNNRRLPRTRMPGSLLESVRQTAVSSLIRLLAGHKGLEAWNQAMVRRSGETHLWMYDRFSLRILLEGTGFVNVRRCKPDASAIPHFSAFELDTVGGEVRKADSLFMEARRP